MSLAVEPARMLIDGEWVEPASGTTTSSTRRPSRSSARPPRPAAARRRRGRRRARPAFRGWSRTTPEHRAELLDAVADLLAKRDDELVPLVQAETGATMRVA